MTAARMARYMYMGWGRVYSMMRAGPPDFASLEFMVMVEEEDETRLQIRATVMTLSFEAIPVRSRETLPGLSIVASPKSFPGGGAVL